MPSAASLNGGGPKVAVVAGLRTPFARQATVFQDLSALDLGRLVVRELIERTEVPPSEVQQVSYGQVVPSLNAPNIAREIVLGTGLPRDIDAFSVSRACATGYQSTADIALAIRAGAIDCGVSGGADSASIVPIAVSPRLGRALLRLSKAKTVKERLRTLAGLRPRDLVPEPPSPTEPSTGLTMGESAEKMAKENGITRAEQDAFAHRSHTLAAKAWADGRFAEEVMPVYVAKGAPVVEDNNVRKDSTLEGYASLKPAFDRKYGTITAGNSSPLTDGASALLLMREDKVRTVGLPILCLIRSICFVAVDPMDQLLIGPAYAIPIALERAGCKLGDMGLVDLHEAFAAQVISVVKALASKKFAEEKLGQGQAVGEIDPEKLNVMGGSIAVGHPFAATGARQITQTCRELRRRYGGGLALVSACAAGGLGAAMVLEVVS